MESPLVKLLVGKPSTTSRYQETKFQVLPGRMAVLKGAGKLLVFTEIEMDPADPEFPTWVMKRPMLPERQRLPDDPPGFTIKPWVAEVTK